MVGLVSGIVTAVTTGATGLPGMTPSSAGLPGTDEIQKLVDTLGWIALTAALIGLVIGAGMWAVGAHANNYQQTSSGRRAVLVAGAAALVIGAAPAVLSFMYTAGAAFK